MPQPRQMSESGFYHVYSRGAGKMTIFEDDRDRTRFVRQIATFKEGLVEIHAWCLMDNHCHLLIRSDTLEKIAAFMAKLNGGYTRYYNLRYDHSGHLFQGRYGCQPVDTDEYLLAVVRYIHRNPLEGALTDSCDYPWSSFREYYGKAAVAETLFVQSYFSSVEDFQAFHDAEEILLPQIEDFDEDDNRTSRGAYDEKRNRAEVVLGFGWQRKLFLMDKRSRNESLRLLKEAGFSVRELERMTGISRKIISAA